MNSKTIRQFLIFLIFFLLLTALIGFTYYDLETSQKLYGGETTFSLIFAFLGKLPGFLLMMFSALILSCCVGGERSNAKNALIWLYRLILFGASSLFFHAIFENFMLDTMLLLLSAVCSGLALALVLIVAAKFIPRSKWMPLEKWAMLTLILTVAVFGATSVLKIAIGRMRYKDILGNPELFTRWYEFDFFGEGNSFPSGHVALASTLVTVPLLLKTLNAKRYIALPIDLICLAFVTLTFFSRVTAGHHYMTDVFAALTIALAFYFILHHIFYHNGKMHFDNATKAEKVFRLGL